MYMCVRTCVLSYLRMCVLTYIHTYIHTYMYIHTYIHTCNYRYVMIVNEKCQVTIQLSTSKPNVDFKVQVSPSNRNIIMKYLLIYSCRYSMVIMY